MNTKKGPVTTGNTIKTNRVSTSESVLSLAIETPIFAQPQFQEKPKVNVDLIRSSERYTYRHAFSISGSVIPSIIIPVALFTLWGFFWCILLLNHPSLTTFNISNQLIIILNVSISLLLVFKNNSSYDRFMESRRVWGQMTTCIRNLARSLMIKVTLHTEREQEERISAVQLLTAYPVAMKHHLRQEFGVGYSDLYPLVSHIPSLRKAGLNNVPLPLQLTWHLSSYIKKLVANGQMPGDQHILIVNSLMLLVDSLTIFERVQNTPIPWAYSIHLKQTVLLYLTSLPFQLIASTGYAAIPIIFVTSFVLLGIEKIGSEIEFPFGFDASDLPLEQFCLDITTEIEQMVASFRSHDFDPGLWRIPNKNHHQQIPSNTIPSMNRANSPTSYLQGSNRKHDGGGGEGDNGYEDIAMVTVPLFHPSPAIPIPWTANIDGDKATASTPLIKQKSSLVEVPAIVSPILEEDVSEVTST